MASSVFYKFKSQRDESRVTFDGTGISVFDLKREIILANNLGKANDFDLHLYDSKTNEEFTDDTQTIQRSSSVIAKRLPARHTGRGNAALYTAGSNTNVPLSEPVPRSVSGAGAPSWHKGSLSKRFDGKEETPRPETPTPMANSIQQSDEAAAMAAMFKAQSANWEETQEKMSQATPIYNSSRGGAPRGGGPRSFQSHVPDRPLPPSYVCYRCGQKGHWIKDCPTNNDRDYDNRPRIKRTTGIPRSMLKSVDNPDAAQLGQGVMVTPEGGYVVAQPDAASWQKQVSQKKGLTAAEVRERPPTDPSLACPIDNALFRDAVKTPCCGTSFCEDCIQSHLLERDFICPNCNKKVASLDKLGVDKPMRTKVVDYIERAMEESKRDADDMGVGSSTSMGEDANGEQDLYSEQQPGGADMTIEMQQIVDSIPQIQAQIAQISLMLNNPSLPKAVRQTTEMQHQQLQMQLQQAQAVSAALATIQQQTAAVQNVNNVIPNGGVYTSNMTMGQGFNNQPGPKWTNPYSSLPPAGMDSAYQRLPINNRRRNVKRERPSDFLEVSGDSKVPRYWE